MPFCSKPHSRICLIITCFCIFFSCTKHHDNPPISPPVDQHHILYPFSSQAAFLQPNAALISWSASEDSAGDAIKYKILLNGKIVDSNLTRLSDTLKGISRGIVYRGSVVAYNNHNDTVSAPFTLDVSSTAYIYFYKYDLYKAQTTLECQDLFTNQRVWSFDPNLHYGAPNGTPAVVNDTIYVNCNNSLGSSATLVVAVNAKTGEVIWRSPQLSFGLPFSGDATVASSDNGPIYNNGKVYTNTINSITCLNSSNGQVLWSSPEGDYCTTPIIDGGKVFVGTYVYDESKSLDTFAFNAFDAVSGAAIWKKPISGDLLSGAVLASNGVFIYGDLLNNTSNENITALDQSTGVPDWTQRGANTIMKNPIHYNNLLICWVANQLSARDMSTGMVVWQLPDFSGYEGSDPFISHDTVFVSRSLYGSTNSGQFQLLAVSATIGAVFWTSISTPSNPTFLCVAGGRIYMEAPDFMSLNTYSSKDGSFMGSVNATSGVIVNNGMSYYPAESGMVQ